METLYNNKHQEVIERCRKGDTKAQFELYKLYYKPMFNTCLRIVGNGVEAEDVMQEAFLKAFTKIGTYEGKVSIGSWLRKIVVNQSLDQIKKRKVKFEEIDEKIPDDETSYSHIVDIQVEQVKKAIWKLPDAQRIVLSLYLIEGYDHEEIARNLGISVVMSRTQLFRAKQKLRQYLLKNELFENT